YVAESRQLAARLTGVNAEEIAFTGNTSMGLAMVAEGLPWQAGDNVVCYRDDYPANVYPWMNLARRGVEVRFVTPAVPGRITVAELEPVVDRRTRLVALPSAHFLTGWRLDIAAISAFLRDRGVLFCLDAIQTLGALDTPLRYVDFAAADAHKWLLGPVGVAVLYVRRELQDLLRPALVGWNNAKCPGFITREQLEFWPNARRYEPGTLMLAGIVGLHAGLEMILNLGPMAIEQRVLALARRLGEQLTAGGWSLLGPDPREFPSGLTGIVTFHREGLDMIRLYERLRAERIHLSLRQDRQGRHYLRASAHFYNTERDLDKFAECLLEALA
ncbi:MAG: aminotransferase class V-fold PLP-dependent enzyme, partial [Verrucomicrobiae bacterium]|nr:aminotransferase class V-fold PLP-dependent enzyme [Verrucomicrobiae bacterium]